MRVGPEESLRPSLNKRFFACQKEEEEKEKISIKIQAGIKIGLACFKRFLKFMVIF